jgi:hypothetical protein
MPAIKYRSLIPASHHPITERPGVWSALRIGLKISL